MQLISILLHRQNHRNSQPAGCPLPLRYHPPPSPQHDPPLPPSHSLSSFSPVTETDLSLIVSSMKTSTCALDPLPSSLVKACLPSLSPLITNIINSSLSSGLVPPPTQARCCHPRTDKTWSWPRHPQQLPAHLQAPLPVESRERAVASQLKSHLNLHNLYEPFQSGFRSKHSTAPPYWKSLMTYFSLLTLASSPSSSSSTSAPPSTPSTTPSSSHVSSTLLV